MAATTETAPASRTVVIDKSDLERIIEKLWRDGYTVIGPTIAQGAIVFDELRALKQLPIGWTDEQEGGKYRLKPRDDGAYFGYAVGPHSWKKYLFPSRLTLFSIEKTADSFAVKPSPEPVPKYAFVGAARATCTPSIFRIRSSWRALMSTRIIRLVVNRPSSSR